MSNPTIPLFSDFVAQRQSGPPSFDDFIKARTTAPPIAAPQLPAGLQGPTDTQLNAQPDSGRPYGGMIPKQVVDFAKNAAQPTADALLAAPIAASATTLGGPIAGFAGGVAGYTAADQAIEKIKDIIRGKTGNKTIPDSAIEGLINETGGKLIGAGVKAAKGLVKPGQQAISDLGGTVSQYLESIGQDSSKNATLRWLANTTKGAAKTLEDVAAPTSKKAAIAGSGTIGEEALGPAPNAFGGDDPNAIAKTIKGLASQQRKVSFVESNQQAMIPKIVAKNSTIDVQVGQEPDTVSKMLDQNGQPAIIPGKPIYKTVEGPTNLPSVSSAATEIVQNAKNAVLDDPSNASLVNVGQRILDSTQGGKNPINFSDAWDLKQEIDANSGWAKLKQDVTPQDRAFRKLGSLMNDDIDNSIPNWQSDSDSFGGAKEAMKGWQLAKATVEQRNLTFNPEGSGTQNLSHIIENANSSLPAVNATLLDSEQLQRALNAGEQLFPSGKISNPNGRLVYQAANDVRIRDLAKTKDSITGQYRIDPDLITKAWDAPEFAASRKILYSQQQDADMSQFYKQLAMTQQKQQGIGISSKMYMARNGLMLAAPLVAGTMTGHTAIGAGFAGLEVGSLVLAKAMNTPRLARAMIAAAAGQPLSMSDQSFNRMLFGAIQGTVVTSVGTDGSRQKGTMDKDGKFTPQDQ
jgi:hypothetical protein